MKYIVIVYVVDRMNNDVFPCEYSGILHDNYDEAHEEYFEALMDTFENPRIDSVCIQEI